MGVQRRQRVAIAGAVATRAAVGGMLTTALAVFVGRQGSAFAVSMLSAAFFFNTMVFTPLWGALGDLTGRRRSIMLGLSGLSTATLLGFLLVESVWGLIGVRALHSLFAVGFGPLMLAVVGDLEGRAHRGRAAGFFTRTFAAGDVGAQLLVGAMLGALAPSRVFAVVGAVSLLSTVLLVPIADPKPEPNAEGRPGDAEGRSEDAADGPATAPVPDGGLSPATVRRAVVSRLVPGPAERATFRESGLTWLFLALIGRHMCVKGVGALVPIYLLTRVGTSEFAMGALLTVGSGVQIALTNRFGRMADGSVGNRKTLVVVGAFVSGLYGPLLASATVPDALPVRIAVAAAGFVAVAAGFAALEVGTITIVGGAVPPSREAAFLGLRSTAAGVGGVLGPTLVGALVVLVGYRAAFSAAALLAFLAAGLLATRLSVSDRTGSTDAARPMVETAVGLSHPLVHALGNRVGRRRRAGGSRRDQNGGGGRRQDGGDDPRKPSG